MLKLVNLWILPPILPCLPPLTPTFLLLDDKSLSVVLMPTIPFLKGATIKTDEETGKIIIARIMHGGAADRSGLIHVGDEVIEVNNINVEGKTPGDVLQILVSRLT